MDPYAVLGVAKDASQDDIRKAYKRIARESHPDLNPGDAAAESRFKEVQAAFDLLKDPEKRARFDRGEIDAEGQERPQRRYYRDFASGPEASYSNARGFEDFGDFTDIFGDLAGRRGGEGFAMRGATLYFTVELDFLEAARGGTRRIVLPGGGGPVELTIPPGIAEGEAIRLPGRGGAGRGGGPAGDALVAVAIRPHPFFRREGDDVHLELPVTLDEAVLGGKVEAPTIDGPVALAIPKGTSSGRQLRLRGRGIQRGGRRGDQIITVKIVAPPEVDEELEAFMRQWRKTHRYDPRMGMKP